MFKRFRETYIVKKRNSIAIKTIPLSRLKKDLPTTVNERAEWEQAPAARSKAGRRKRFDPAGEGR
jgi:hypothetical protein